MKIILLCLLLTGCTKADFGAIVLKCINGKVYSRYDDVWIEAKIYSSNKCLPVAEESESE